MIHFADLEKNVLIDYDIENLSHYGFYFSVENDASGTEKTIIVSE